MSGRSRPPVQAQPNTAGKQPNVLVSGHLIPTQNETFDIGTPTNRFRTGYFSTNTLYIGSTPLSVNAAGNIVAINAAGSSAFAGDDLTEGFLVAVGDDAGGPNTILWSVDGSTWNPIRSDSARLGLGYDVAWNGATWIAVGSGDGTTTYKVLLSSDGRTWIPPQVTPQSALFTAEARGVFWGGNEWVISASDGATGRTLWHSFDGHTWTQASAGAFATNQTYGYYGVGNAVASSGSIWVAVGQGDNTVLYSYDADIWIPSPSSTVFTYSGDHVMYSGTTWIAAGFDSVDGGVTKTPKVLSSTDGINWVIDTNPIQSGNQQAGALMWNGVYWLIVGSDLGVYRSYDGTTWTQISTIGGSQVTNLAWTGDEWVVTGSGLQPSYYASGGTDPTNPNYDPNAPYQNLTFMASIDGITWTATLSTSFSTIGNQVNARKVLPYTGTILTGTAGPQGPAGIGVVAGFIRGSMSVDKSNLLSNPGEGTTLVFDVVTAESVNPANITPNVDGSFTLAPGRTYRLTASVPTWQTSSVGLVAPRVSFRWYNKTSSTFIGASQSSYTHVQGQNGSSGAPAETVISIATGNPSITVDFRIESLQNGGILTLGQNADFGVSDGSLPWYDIQVIGGNAPVDTLIGATGVAGPVGPQGVQGAVGPQGLEGATGPIGITGSSFLSTPGMPAYTEGILGDSYLDSSTELLYGPKISTLVYNTNIPNLYQWSPVNSTASAYWSGVSVNSNGTRFFVSQYSTDLAGTVPGYVYSGTFSAGVWTLTDVTSGTRAFWTGVAGTPDGTTLYATSLTSPAGLLPVYTSNTGGWAATSSPVGAWSGVACSYDGTQILATMTTDGASRPGGVFLSTDSGNSWGDVGIGQGTWGHPSMSSNASVLAVAQTQQYYNDTFIPGYVWTSNSTTGWVNQPTPDSWNDVAVSGDGLTLLAAGTQVYLSNATTSWSDTGLPSGNWTAVTSSSNGVVLSAAQRGGVIYLSIDAGATWTAQPLSLSAAWTSLGSSQDGLVQIAGQVGNLTTNATPWPFLVSIAGRVGPTGLSITGETGATGVQGVTGVQGPQGSFLRTGYGDPSPSLGLAGDTYVDLSSGAFYNRTSVYTPSLTTITWTQGATAGTWYGLAVTNNRTVYATSGGSLYTGQFSNNALVLSPIGGVPSSSQWIGLATSSNAQTIYLSGPDGGNNPQPMYVSTNAGATWTAGDVTDYFLYVASSYDGSIAVAVADFSPGGVYITSNSGTNWTGPINPGVPGLYWTQPAISSNGQVMIVAQYRDITDSPGSIYISSNAGSTWSNTGLAYTWEGLACSADGSSLIIASGLNGTYSSTDGGVTWTSNSLGVQATFLAVSSNGLEVAASVDPGNVYWSADAGQTWVLETSLGSDQWQRVAMSPDGSIAAVGSRNPGAGFVWAGLIHRIPSTSWMYDFSMRPYSFQSGTGVPAYSVGNVGDTYLDVATGNLYGPKTAFTYDLSYGSESWVTTNVSASWSAVFTASQGALIYSAANGGSVYNRSNAFSSQPGGGVGPWMTIAGSSNGQIIYVGGTAVTTYTSPDAGVSWNPGDTTENWVQIASGSVGDTAFGIGSSNVYLTSNYGVSWTLLTDASLPTGTLWTSIACSSNAQYVIASLTGIGGVYYNTTGGLGTWTQAGSGLAGIGTLAVSSDGTMIIAGQNTGGSGYVFLSGNGGSTWSPTSLPSLNWTSVAASSNGQILVAAATTDMVYVSPDYGTTWFAQTGSGTGSWTGVSISPDAKTMAAVDSTGMTEWIGVPQYLRNNTGWVLDMSLVGPTGPSGGPTGATGPQGPAGDPGGATGPQGLTGVQGPTGPQGILGPPGSVGSTGIRGPTGLRGHSGPTGPHGPLGPTGTQGPSGPSGPRGYSGPSGPTGPQGDLGPSGPTGPQGESGPLGPTGVAGPTGVQGFTGPSGPLGPTGVRGIQGPKGDPGGATGIAGPTGATGVRGLSGPTGPTGPSGPEGPSGATGVVSVTSENFMVATGYGTYDIAYTYDGSNWVGTDSNVFTGNSANGYAWGVAWNGNMWVATGNGNNTLAYSSDGNTWHGAVSSPFNNYAWGVAWNGHMWVATGGQPEIPAECSIAYSYDGMNWTAVDTSSSLIFSYGGFGVAWGGAYWVAVGGGSNTFATSYDGINWTPQVSNVIFGDAGVQAIAYNGNLWVAVGNNGGGGTSTIAYSSNGSNWVGADASSNIFSSWGNTVAWNGSIWVAGGTSASGQCLAYSYDASNWTLSPSQTFNIDCWSVAWNGIQWTAVGDSNSTIAKSSDGLHWTPITNSLFTDGYAVAARRTLFRTTPPFAGGLPKSILYTTASGTVAGASGFTYDTSGSVVTLSGDFMPGSADTYNLGSADKPWHHLYVGAGTVYIGDVAISSASGNIQFTNISTGQSAFTSGTTSLVTENFTVAVAHGSGSDSAAYSPDGINWTSVGASNGLDGIVNRVAWNGALWVEVGSSFSVSNAYSIAYSSNGINWVAADASNRIFTYAGGNGVATNGQEWVAVGMDSNNSFAYSSNGTTWLGLGGGPFGNYDTNYGSGQCVAWGNNMWVAGGYGYCSIATSPDGLNWTAVDSSAGLIFGNVANIAYNGHQWVAVGGYTNGTLAYSPDALHWTFADSGGNQFFNDGGQCIAWNGVRWLAGGYDDEGNALKTSMDGSNWTTVSIPNLIVNGSYCWVNSIDWNGSVWNIIGRGRVNNRDQQFIAYSYDSSNWTLVVDPLSNVTGYGLASRRVLPYVGVSPTPPTPTPLLTENFMLVGGSNDDTGFSFGYSYDGLTWQAQKNTNTSNLIGGASVTGIAWSGTTWVATTCNVVNPIIVSPDGFNWMATTNANGIFTQGNGVAWNGQIWVASGSYNYPPFYSLAYSTDGLTWTGVSNSGTLMYQSTRTAWNGSIWVATGSIGENLSGSSLAYSYDGMNWSGVSNSTQLTYTARGIAWNGNYFLATCYPGASGPTSTILKSYDGINWSGVDTSSNVFTNPAGGLGIAWNGVMWVAAGNVNISGGGSIVYSYDGSNWTCADLSAQIFSPTATGVAWNGRVWVVTGFGPGSSSNNYSMAISYDGIHWREPDLDKTLFPSGFGMCLAARRPLPYVGTTTLPLSQTPKTMTENFMVAAGYGNADLTYSYDGLKWYLADTNNIFGGTSGDGYAWSVAWSGNLWVAAGQGSNTLAYSSDGIRWTAVSNSPFTESGWAVAWNGTMWVAGGQGSNTLAYSLDGINWTGADASSNVFTGGAYAMTWNGTKWLAGGGSSVGGDSNVFAYSYDGSNWMGVTSSVFLTECQGLTWNGRFWVAAGSSGVMGQPNFAYSYDGSNWTAGASSELFTSWANGVQWNGCMYVGCGQGSNGSLAYSYDGSNWFPASNNPFTVGGHITTCWSVAWNGAVWIAAGDQDLSDGAKSMAYSYDGMTWTRLNNPLANAYAVASRRVLPYVGYSPAPPTTNLPFGIANNLTWTGTGIGDSYQASISNVSPYLTTSSAIHYNVTCDSTNLADAMSCWIFSANPTNMSGGSITFYSQNNPITPANFPITWSVAKF